ncbi:MAG: VOC family protein [Halieaceae bacterium]|nr:VOC family protein [Halieaceae bacterium]
MPSKSPACGASPPDLQPRQVCFVVDNVSTAVAFCRQRFGWGPFHQFKAPVAAAAYRDWTGEKLTEVALGMAGAVQVELLRVHYGRDTTADYQAEYGAGLQHLGIHCRSRDTALAHLVSLGAKVNEVNEYPGVRFAFVDVPTGPGMFEILQPTEEMASNAGISSSGKPRVDSNTLFDIDRATIVTADMDKALAFYAAAFGWSNPAAARATLRHAGKLSSARRHIGKAGKLRLEIIEPHGNGDDPYSGHLRRGSHGLIHAGGEAGGVLPAGEAFRGEWLETGESFALYDWPGGERSLQIRREHSMAG